MHSARPYHNPAPVSPVAPPVDHHQHAQSVTGIPPRPHLEVYTGHTIPCQDSGSMQYSEDYIARDMFTPSPTSSSSVLDTPLPYYSQEAFMLPPYSAVSSSTTSSSGTSPSIAPSRRQARRLSEPACLNDNIVVKGPITHPYARLYSKKNGAGKRRKMWNHQLEKLVFTPQEISTMGAPTRRTIYTASLEAHIDRLHEQLLSYQLVPVPLEKLEPYRGLNAKTCKSMVSGLHHDAVEIRLKILEIDRAIKGLQDQLNAPSTSY